MDILDHIPVGKENAIKRAELCRILKLPDRKVRRFLEDLREEHPIANLQDGSGYFIPDTEADARAQRAITTSRLISLSNQIDPLDRQIERLSGQTTL